MPIYNRSRSRELGFFSASAIVATLGVLLIGCGIAWTLATNWHLFSATAKVLILGGLTCGSFFIGGLAESKAYEGVAAALHLLGSSLLSLSLVLLAQIFNLEASIDGAANLTLLSWVSITVISYVLNSKLSLLLALFQFNGWIAIKYLSVFDFNGPEMPSFGVLVELYLASAALLFGVALVHSVLKHRFDSTYRWWFVFYILVFTYLLSFEFGLPFLKLRNDNVVEKFSIYFSWTAIIIYALALVFAFSRDRSKAKEIIASVVLFLGLYWFLNHAGYFATFAGSCEPKLCGQQNDQAGCEYGAELGLGCVWTNGYCSDSSCNGLDTQEKCDQATPAYLGCKWQESYCRQQNCYDFQAQDLCEAKWNGVQLCRWNQTYCTEFNCNNYFNKADCDTAPKGLNCLWIESSNVCAGRFGTSPTALLFKGDCGKYEKDPSACQKDRGCFWQPLSLTLFGSSNEAFSSSLLNTTWLIGNAIALLTIVACSIYGVLYGSAAIVNVSVVFFVLLVISRYLGFLVTFWGYTSMSMVFISGGTILLLGGWITEKWRRKSVAKAKEKER